MQLRSVTLESLGNGIFIERFQQLWERLLENVFDPDTDAKVTRELNFCIKVTPMNTDRDQLDIKLKAIPKLAAPKPYHGVVYAGKQEGHYVAFETTNPNQMSMFTVDENGMKGEIA